MHIHESMASTAHKIAILGKIILSNCDTTEFDTTSSAATCQAPDAFRILWIWKDLEGCSFPSQPHRGPCEVTHWQLIHRMKPPKLRFKVSIHDYLQIKLPWFRSFSFKLWWVRWRSVSVNRVVKINGHPREPAGQNYFSSLSRLFCLWLHSNVAARRHILNVFLHIYNKIFIIKIALWDLLRKQIWSYQITCNKAHPLCGVIRYRHHKWMIWKHWKMCFLFGGRNIFKKFRIIIKEPLDINKNIPTK